LFDGAVGGALLAAGLSHGRHRDVLAHFFVYWAVLAVFKLRDAGRRIGVLVAQARLSDESTLSLGPWWLRVTRLLLGYDSWSRTERFGVAVVSVLVCLLFGWDDGGPFAGALFLALAAVNAALALVAIAARLSARRG
jgi:hypothetical protein